MTDRSTAHVLLEPTPLRLDLAAALRPELPSVAEEIVQAIRDEVPDFARRLGGRSGTSVRLCVERGLRQFLDRTAAPGRPRPTGATGKIFRSLGRGEYLAGRNLDALQSAYRIGARVAWSRFARAGREAGAPPDQLYILAEALFGYLEEISAHSVDAYTELATRASDQKQRARERLLELLLAEPSVSPARLGELAAQAQWRLPHRIACVALSDRWNSEHRLSPGMGAEALVDLDRPDPCLLLPDPDGPGRMDALRHALNGVEFAVGPTVPLTGAAYSLRLARQALSLMRRGLLPAEGQIRCEDHLSTLLLLSDEESARLLVEHRLAALGYLESERNQRLAETLLAWLTSGVSTMNVAERLRVHPQTVRYRMRQLKELFGDLLHDPEWRFETELALRMHRLFQTEESEEAVDEPRSPAAGRSAASRHSSADRRFRPLELATRHNGR
ncbi:PucR family transcriptional regulator [Actinomadura rugatobispora]|uniref:PucR family transcriptional regulator n=1 Tax=Actinomadura rugatobispora TaxID=1994 RepID=A0ABW1AI57_9ACTN|nr:helix-turn-helix domain-containing protein [Actinomadura rugatobispora]